VWVYEVRGVVVGGVGGAVVYGGVGCASGGV
jgi:hypothetical protein